MFAQLPVVRLPRRAGADQGRCTGCPARCRGSVRCRTALGTRSGPRAVRCAGLLHLDWWPAASPGVAGRSRPAALQADAASPRRQRCGRATSPWPWASHAPAADFAGASKRRDSAKLCELVCRGPLGSRLCHARQESRIFLPCRQTQIAPQTANTEGTRGNAVRIARSCALLRALARSCALLQIAPPIITTAPMGSLIDRCPTPDKNGQEQATHTRRLAPRAPIVNWARAGR